MSTFNTDLLITEANKKKKDYSNDVKRKVLDAIDNSSSKSDLMSKLKKIDKEGGGTKWGDPGYMKKDVFNALISCTLGVPSGLAAGGMTSLGIVGSPIGILGLYLTGVVFHLNATKYDKFHLLENYNKKIKGKKKLLEIALKTEKDPKMKKEIQERIKEADKCLKAIDKERRALLPKKEREKVSSTDDLDDFDFDWDDDDDWINIDDIQLDESYILSESSIITESKKKDSLKPVFITTTYTGTNMGKLIKAYTHDKFTHAGLSLDSSLEYIYSYNGSNGKIGGGLSFESLSNYIKYNKDSKLLVSVVYLKDRDYSKLKSIISDYVNHYNQSTYNFMGLFDIIFNKERTAKDQYSMVCSQFVDNIFKMLDIDITGTSSNIVTPGVLSRVKNPKVYLLYDGLAAKYNVSDINKKLSKLSKGAIAIKESNSLCLVNPICETKEFPIGFNEEGDLIIRKGYGINFEEEHAKSKRLYPIYKKNNNLEAMAYEADKLWYMNSLLSHKLNSTENRDSKKYEDLLLMRSKVLNEFNLYVTYISRKDDSYNFSSHYRNSPFCDAQIKITKNTFKYVLKYIKNFFMVF